MILFECAVKTERVQENGTTKKVTDRYIVEAVSYGDAEAQAVKLAEDNSTGEFALDTIKKTKFAEVFYTDKSDAVWFACTVEIIMLDEATGTEKSAKQAVLVQAPTMTEALKTVSDKMGMYDILTVVIKRLNIEEVVCAKSR